MKDRNAVALGRKGGKARAARMSAEERRSAAIIASQAARAARAAMSPEERTDLARRAARARWDKVQPSSDE